MSAAALSPIATALDALTLIHAAVDLSQSGGCLSDAEGNLTDVSSRLDALLIMARDKMVEIVRFLDGGENEAPAAPERTAKPVTKLGKTPAVASFDGVKVTAFKNERTQACH
jgi:hypothetical protein